MKSNNRIQQNDLNKVCSHCKRIMVNGYVIHDGEEYFCSDACLLSKYTDEQYEEMFNAGEAYWTQWDWVLFG